MAAHDHNCTEGQEELTQANELRIRIENATRDVEKSYRKTLEKVNRLKEKMNKWEQRANTNSGAKTRKEFDSLNFAIESLNRLTDSQILRSKKAWNKCKKLEQDGKQRRSELPELDNLRAWCKKTEELAADLLCYSLGHLKQRELHSG